MKTTAKLFLLVLLALPTGAQAQFYECTIGNAFEKILSTSGISHSTSQSILRNDEGGTAEKTVINDFRIGEANFKHLDALQKAFEVDEKNASAFYTCFNPIQGSYRQQWAVKMRRGGDFRIGEKPGSSYAIATFDDDARPGYRTVYAVEWWNTDDAHIKEGVLITSYGEKPFMHSQQARPSFGRSWQQALSGADSILARIPDADSLLTDAAQLSRSFGYNLGRYKLVDTKAAPENIPHDGISQGEWMNKAINRIDRLSNSDWHRVFALLTQKMIDRANDSKEEMVVTAGVVLDLCKHADQLDDDEKEVCVRRLNEVVDVLIHMDRLEYVCDLIQLAAKKLAKERD